MTKIYEVEIPSEIVQETFSRALGNDAPSRAGFFTEIRRAFKREMEKALAGCGLEVSPHSTLSNAKLKAGAVFELNPIVSKYGERLGIDFCARYGVDDYSLGAVNYIERGYCELPSLFPFVRVPGFSIGNVAIVVGNKDYGIRIARSSAVDIVGYSYEISSRKKKSYLCLYGIRFEPDALRTVISPLYENCICQPEDLDEVHIGYIHYPIMYICRRCGQLFTCECFSGYFDIRDGIIRFLPHGGSDPELRDQVKAIKIWSRLCHLCQGGIPKFQYGGPMYYTLFLQSYLPYHDLWARMRYGRPIYGGEESKEIENQLRERFGYPRIGERWISETSLYRTVQFLFAPLDVMFHYRGRELEGLELDIWIPELMLAIEYQGEQHFEPLEHWGGEDGLKKRTENDRKKKALCKKLGYRLVEYRYDEQITTESVERKLKRFLP